MSDKGLGELERLSNSETQLIRRRRRGESQLQAARRLGLSHSMYSKWERGLVDCPRERVLPLKAHERCLLYRRRANVTQEDVAQDLRCCRWWVNRMEHGEADCTELCSYWEC